MDKVQVKDSVDGYFTGVPGSLEYGKANKIQKQETLVQVLDLPALAS